jgi:hypothetical protein
MSSSRSSPTNTTSTNTNAEETNLAATNTQGVTLVGNKGSTTLNSDSNNYTSLSDSGNTSTTTNTLNFSTDEGAVANGTALGQSAIAANTNLSEFLAKDYANETDTLSAQSTNLVSQVLTQGFQFLANENDTIQNIETQNANAQSEQIANYASTLSNISTAQDTSQASQSTAFATSALKIAAVVVLGLAVIFVAMKES